MPSQPPRQNTAKKRVQLAKREQELTHAIRNSLPDAQLVRAAEAVRTAQLSLLKAELYWAEDPKNIYRDRTSGIPKIQRDQQMWTEKSAEEIVSKYRDF